MIDPWVTVFCVIGLLWSDTKSMAWGFFLGCTLALGLYDMLYTFIILAHR